MKPSSILPIDKLDYGHRGNDEVMLQACFQIVSDSIEEVETFDGNYCA